VTTPAAVNVLSAGVLAGCLASELRTPCDYDIYPAQQESLLTSLVKVWAQSFNASTIVR